MPTLWIGKSSIHSIFCKHSPIRFHLLTSSFRADYYDPPGELAECIAFKFAADISLTDADKAELSNIRRRKLPELDDMDLRHVILGLLDILFAYVYDLKVINTPYIFELNYRILFR